MKEKELKGKFIVAYDTVCDGWQCMMQGEEGDSDYQRPGRGRLGVAYRHFAGEAGRRC